MSASSLSERHLQAELMDQPGIEAGEHHRALRALARVNSICGSARILWPSIRDLCRERAKAGDLRPIRLLDIATGAGDVPVRIWRQSAASSTAARDFGL